MKVRLHPSAILWLSVLGYLRPKIVFPFLLSAVLHELGHALMLLWLGQAPREICFRLEGARMETPPLSYRQELLCAMAGPVVSLLLGLTLPVFPMLGGYSLCLGLFNLLPLGSLDGPNYCLEFVIAGAVGMARSWALQGFPQAEEALARLADRLISSGLAGTLQHFD